MLNEKQVGLFLLAIENLDKPMGDWTDEAIIEHLKSNIKLARGYMEKVIEENDNINSVGFTTKSEQVYATIRPGTRYQEQCNGSPFPVRFQLESDGYHWQGGPGGRYRTSDLLLYKLLDGDFRQFSTFHHDEPMQIIDFTLEHWEQWVKDGALGPDWFTPYSEKLITRLQKIEAKARETYPEEEEEDYV